MATVLFCTADHIFPLQERLFPYVPLGSSASRIPARINIPPIML